MKLVLLIAALLFQTPRGSVTGTVLVAGTSTPIAEADVAVLTREGLLETTTDANGRFSLPNVPVGPQTVLIRADGFFGEPPAANMAFPPKVEVPVTVLAGPAPIAMPPVSLVRSGTISGRVVDSQGLPLPHARVEALRTVAGTADPDQLRGLASRATDDRGEYRMFWVPPGEYVVRALGGPPPAPGGPPLPPGQVQRLVPTFFPNKIDSAEASKVIVKPGEDVRGVDIATQLVVVNVPPPPTALPPGSGFKISGLVIDGMQPWVGTAGLLLGSSATGEVRPVGSVIIGGTPGQFEIPNVPPGKYELFASLGSPNGAGWGRVLFEVRDSDVTDLRVVVHPSVDVPGVVKVDGKAGTTGGTLKIGLSPKGVARGIGNYRSIIERAQAPGADGKFSISGAAEGEYDVFLQGAPDNLYIADIRQGDTSIKVSGLGVGRTAPSAIEVILASDGGTVEGVAENADKSPVRGATVVLVVSEAQSFRVYQTTTANAEGKYTFRGVRPGEYKVLAGSTPLPPAGLTPEMLSGIAPGGLSVTVKTGSSVKADVTVAGN